MKTTNIEKNKNFKSFFINKIKIGKKHENKYE